MSSINIYDPSTGELRRLDKNPNFTGATALAAGTDGCVPAPAAGDQNKLLKGDGTWYELTPEKLGSGYGTCSTAESTIAKEATLASYELVTNGYVSVKFNNAVPASATLSINSKTAKPIFYHGAAITAGVISAGDLATFVYDGTNYNLVGVDSLSTQMQTLTNDVGRLKNRKVVIIADSYGMVHNTTFLSILKSTFPNIYDGIGISSIGFTPVSPYTFTDQFDIFIDNYTAEQKQAVTDIIFCGGWNDAREIASGNKTQSDLQMAMKTTIDHVLTVCPNAMVHGAFMAWHSERSQQNQVTLASLLRVLGVYNNLLYNRYSPLTDTKYVMRDINAMDASLFHPNEGHGAQSLAQCLHANLFSGSAHYRTSMYYVAGWLDDNDAGFGNDFKLRVSIDDNITRLSCFPVLMNGTITGGIIGVWNKAHTPVILPGNGSEIGEGEIIIIPVMLKGTINGTAYAHYVPSLMYMYAATGNMLLLAPDGTLVTSLSSVYMIINATIDNETCV